MLLTYNVEMDKYVCDLTRDIQTKKKKNPGIFLQKRVVKYLNQ